MISVHNVSMRYGSKVLFDEVTTTFSPGRRYGLTGPNGAGKTTFMKILSGDLEPQKGTVVRPKKMGLIRQDQFAFDDKRVIDTVVMGNPRLWGALQEREELYAKTDMTDADGMRLARARGHRRRGGRLHGGDRRGDPPPGARHRRRSPRAPDARDHERRARPRPARAGALRQPAGAAARRADEPPRPRLDPLARGVPHVVRGQPGRDLARPALPEPRVHAHRGHRLPDDHHLHRRLRRHGDRQDAVPHAHRGAAGAAREEDRAAPGVHRPLLGGHAQQPGDVAEEGGRAAADQ